MMSKLEDDNKHENFVSRMSGYFISFWDCPSSNSAEQQCRFFVSDICGKGYWHVGDKEPEISRCTDRALLVAVFYFMN